MCKVFRKIFGVVVSGASGVVAIHVPAMLMFLIVCAFVSTITTAVAGEAEHVQAINLLKNASFEQGVNGMAHWAIGGETPFEQDVSVVHDGKSSLRWHNDNPKTYKLVTQRVPLESGRAYEISGWIKTDDLKGVRESGATIALGYSDHDELYVKGGPHPGGQQGTGDWWKLVAYTGPVPENVAYGTFTCYVRKNGPSGDTFTGTAWWDELALRPVSLEVRLLKPSYKNRVTNDDTRLKLEVAAWPSDFQRDIDEVQIRVRVRSHRALDAAGEPNGLASHGNPDGDPIALEKHYEFNANHVSHTMMIEEDLQHLSPGRYEVDIDLLAVESGQVQVLWHANRLIHRVAEGNDTLRVHVDEHKRLVVDGKPFFPIGLYVRGAPADLLNGTAFNCFMSYDRISKAQMDAAHAANLKVIYSIKDFYNKIWYSPSNIKSIHDEIPAIEEKVQALRDHPALLAWYVNDELGAECLVEHRAHYRLLNEEDPHHPAWSLHDKPREMPMIFDAADIMGIDSYPVPTEPLSKVAADTIATNEAVRNVKPVWAVPQIFNWETFGRQGRPPTLDEMRSMAWQAICNDATGLIFYSLKQVERDPNHPFESRWQEIKTMASEVAAYADVLLSVEDLASVDVYSDDWAHTTVRRMGDMIYIFVVSDGSGEGDVRFKIDHPVKYVERHRLQDGTRQSIPKPDNVLWKGRVLKGEVHVYEIGI